MGQSVSVDSDPAGLKELLGLGLASSPGEQGAGPLDVVSAAHHIKAWRFETRGNCFVEAPVSLCDDGGLFRAQLHRSSSYLILHVQGSGSAAVSASSAVALDEFAARAGSICTPRGLAAPMVSRMNENVSGLRYTIFVWNGRSTEHLLRANVESKAYELDSHLCKGLDRQHGFLESLRHAKLIRGSQDMAGVGNGSVMPVEASTGQPAQNVLVSTLTATPKSGKGSESRTWSRLSRAIWRGTLSSPQAERPTHSIAAKEAESAAPEAKPGKPFVPPLAIGGANASSRQGKPIVPRLALGSLSVGGSGRPQVPLSSSPAGASSGSSIDSSEAMEIDDRADSSSSRKRLRGGPDEDSSPQRTPQTARATPSVPGLGAAAAAAASAPKSARSAEFSSPVPTLGQAQLAEVSDPGSAPGGRMMPALNLGALTGPRQTIASRADAPAMLNLEDINMSEEELMSTYDPDNEDNNYHLPDHLRRRLQLKHFRQVCSEVVPNALFISSYQVASDEEALSKRGITHIVNTAADICDSCFPERFHYLTYYLKDANTEEISLLFYKTLEWIQEAIGKGGRVLVHCREGVSRSATMVIAYLMWRFQLSFEAAHEQIRQVRPICNPNTGFTCQLLQLAKRLGTSGQVAPLSDRPSLFRVAPYHPKEPFLLLVPSERNSIDPRFGWVVQVGLQLILWMGSKVPDPDAVRDTVEEHRRRLDFFERCQCSLTILKEGEEASSLWQALGETPQASLVAIRPEFDADYETMVAACTVSAGLGAGRSSSMSREDTLSSSGAAWEGSGASRSPQPVLAVGS
eukprot:TRINITY_DN91468_c0_g1_i1.p1 TRINITY_DN91468_c0_g1~~TRINITY_DN91468_c0_g1_i1.p1  ORF type:complete len:801 (-),score=129.95 TRINITY_DN91468_c0_g1_i1:10-2412(-)